MLWKLASVATAFILLSTIALGTVSASPNEQAGTGSASFQLLIAALNDANDKGVLSDALNELLSDLFIEYLIAPITGETVEQARRRLSAEGQSTFQFLVAVFNDANDKGALSDALAELLSDLFIEQLIVPITGETKDQVRNRLSAQTTPTVTTTPTVNAIDGTGRKLLAIYMVGSDLEEDYLSGTDDLRELIAGYNALPDKREVEVIVAFGGANKDGWRGMKFANMSQIIADGEDSEFGDETGPSAYLRQYDNANMGDDGSLEIFLDYLRDTYTNFDQRFLTFWDHGNSYKGFGPDTSPGGDMLYMNEIEGAFERSRPGVFDLIGFDACLMASVEVAKVIAPNADYMIASEELEPGHGWLWSAVIQYYAQEDSIAEAGKLMVNNYVQDVHEDKDTGKTLSLLDMSQYDQLVAALNPVISAYGQNILSSAEYSDSLIGGSSSSVVRSYGESERGDERASIDLKHFAQLLAEDPPDADTSAKLDELLDAIDRFVVHSAHDGSRPNSFGIAIDAPEIDESDYDSYKVSQAWLDFEDSYDQWAQSDITYPLIVSVDVSARGITATVQDDNLSEVSTLYGYESGDYFMVVADLDAYFTEFEDEYFTPWNTLWFTVDYDPSKRTEYIPTFFSERYEIDGYEYTEYTAEVDYYRGGESDYDLGVMTLVVDSDGYVVDHYIATYVNENGEIRFDKATHRIDPGDRVRFWQYGYHSEDPSKDDWFAANGTLAFTQAPNFGREIIEFENSSYRVFASDVGGNAVLGDPIFPVWETIVYDGSLDYFDVQMPAGWEQATPNPSAYEVYSIFNSDDDASASIFVEENYALSLTGHATVLESNLIADGAEDISIEWIYTDWQGLPALLIEYQISGDAIFWLAYLSDYDTIIEIIYAFPNDLYDAGRAIAYYSFDTFWVN